MGSVRNDSFDGANNERQTSEILSFQGDRPALIAGDFNAVPDSRSMGRMHDSGRFAPTADRRSTYPRDHPTRRIDYVFGPSAWQLSAERVVDCGMSDHLTVVSDFRLP